MLFEKNLQVKPFLKWAGGKTQLISHIAKRLPDIVNSNSFTFIEPFVGSGAVLFWMLGNFKNIEVVNVVVSRGKNIGPYTMMYGENPIYIITADKEETK